uniref:collagen alpha-1(I) chain-like n=1 Tax=Callithrix jacchus TaxID=9483 RepID=UPI0023DD6491|nr:collagen alpha-1(I) chain-like [Callithrix jacchus]
MAASGDLDPTYSATDLPSGFPGVCPVRIPPPAPPRRPAIARRSCGSRSEDDAVRLPLGPSLASPLPLPRNPRPWRTPPGRVCVFLKRPRGAPSGPPGAGGGGRGRGRLAPGGRGSTTKLRPCHFASAGPRRRAGDARSAAPPSRRRSPTWAVGRAPGVVRGQCARASRNSERGRGRPGPGGAAVLRQARLPFRPLAPPPLEGSRGTAGTFPRLSLRGGRGSPPLPRLCARPGLREPAGRGWQKDWAVRPCGRGDDGRASESRGAGCRLASALAGRRMCPAKHRGRAWPRAMGSCEGAAGRVGLLLDLGSVGVKDTPQTELIPITASQPYSTSRSPGANQPGLAARPAPPRSQVWLGWGLRPP